MWEENATKRWCRARRGSLGVRNIFFSGVVETSVTPFRLAVMSMSIKRRLLSALFLCRVMGTRWSQCVLGTWWKGFQAGNAPKTPLGTSHEQRVRVLPRGNSSEYWRAGCIQCFAAFKKTSLCAYHVACRTSSPPRSCGAPPERTSGRSKRACNRRRQFPSLATTNTSRSPAVPPLHHSNRLRARHLCTRPSCPSRLHIPGCSRCRSPQPPWS